jgi:hypothetical protein
MKSFSRHIRLSSACALVVGFVLALVLTVPPAGALELVVFPIEEDVPIAFDISNPNQFVRLGLGDEYTFFPTCVSSCLNVAGSISTWSATVTFLGVSDNGPPPPGAEFLLVIGAPRDGALPSDPFAPAGYLFSSFSGAGSDPFFVSDGNPGQLSDAEGDVFLALRFPLSPGTPFGLSYQLQLLGTLQNPGAFTQFTRGFVIVPEPGTLALVFGGLLGLALLLRQPREAAARR